jgi:phage FluMu protein Com
MSINFNCPSCGKPLAAPAEFAGKEVRCPGCNNTATVPAVAAPAPVASMAPPTSGSAMPPVKSSPLPGRRCHELDYQIVGDDMQMVIIELDPGETVIAEAGAMNFMEEGINFETKMGDGSQPDKGFFGKMMDVGKRAITGESLFMTHFTHLGSGKSHVAFAAPYPGKIKATIFCVKKMRSSARHWERMSRSRSTRNLEPDYSVVKVLFCRSSLAMAWRVFTLAER